MHEVLGLVPVSASQGRDKGRREEEEDGRKELTSHICAHLF